MSEVLVLELFKDYLLTYYTGVDSLMSEDIT